MWVIKAVLDNGSQIYAITQTIANNLALKVTWNRNYRRSNNKLWSYGGSFPIDNRLSNGNYYLTNSNCGMNPMDLNPQNYNRAKKISNFKEKLT